MSAKRPDPGSKARADQHFSVALPSNPLAPALGRRWLKLHGSELPRPAVERAELLVSELVTNSIRHAGLGHDDRIELRLDVEPAVLRIEVVDPGCGFEVALPPEPKETSGWGLFILEELADRWGRRAANGSLVWFEIDLPGAA